MHKGFYAECGIKGGKLSGGQKQRIAIARAVVRQPDFLILDEATSALDETSQKLVQEALTKVMQDRTSVIIAHRLTTIEKCSRLVLIENGVVAEEGAPEELKNTKGSHFAQLAKGKKKTQNAEDAEFSVDADSALEEGPHNES